MIINLQRDLNTPNEMLGWLSVNGRKWTTLERPWVVTSGYLAGVPGRSCVPAGSYRLEPHSTEAHPKVWALVNTALHVYHWPWEVPASKKVFARTACLIHPATWASELRGCVAPGKSRTKEHNGSWMVRDSRDATNELRCAIGSSADLQLVIEEGAK